MVIFNAHEVFDIAIRIEQNGENAYRNLAFKFNEDKIRQLFTFLADEEVKHREYFSTLARDAIKYEQDVPESFAGEYLEYFKSYVDGKVFSSDTLDAVLNQITTPDEALLFAIQRELDSILYYQEVKSLVSEKQKKFIDQIIDEERQHFLRLQQLRKMYLKNPTA